jgi:hypothetical protein
MAEIQVAMTISLVIEAFSPEGSLAISATHIYIHTHTHTKKGKKKKKRHVRTEAASCQF